MEEDHEPEAQTQTSLQKTKLPTGFTMPKASAVRPSKPIKGAPLLPFTDELEDQAHLHFAKAALRDMRAKLKKEDL